VVKEVVDIKRRFACEVQVHGSAGLARTLIENDLIDEYRLLSSRCCSAPESGFSQAGQCRGRLHWSGRAPRVRESL
jgi:hypothetical protein